ncbi:MAG: sugar ABC transporter permease [Paenibacillus macerans]|uniref:ABC transporter permease subunit n=1 Tax=Paenibacillus macerans TaxID=44252 RepID=A0A090Z1P1_PAEMA|nr:sugar ABC transporter permease [Paenibacillus macerans]KFM98360.1 binding--dependent transport system inner membrane component family protein [Paenibacillus macerans]MBS5910585.1 sugar ABC transporter permease [Paenibacillus macerans]MCY7560443.1 sugar ABC transporter permease [Paenibacillus macerans]MDU7475744.1 sugar ABC transporter permease [Paenibacillus macerans]MEC0137277.1 sugar ABC transporter permease [Paenibacillus macerans]
MSSITAEPYRQKRNSITWLYFLLPSVLIMLIFFIYPVFLTFFYSFTNLALTGESAKELKFVGIDNYIHMFKDPTVRISIWNTLIFLFGSAVIGQQVLGFVIALLMKHKNKLFRRVIGTIVLAGWVTPEIVCALCLYSFFGDEGTLNSGLAFFGIPTVTWLFTMPMLTIILANIWHGTAFSMLVFQAALDDVPSEVEEAAVVDGASRWQVLTRIILPYIKESFVTNMMLVTLQTLGVFGLIYAMTGGGPGTSTTTLPIFMYNQAFVNYQLGYGTAISLLLLLIGVVLSLFYIRSLK